MLTDTLRDIYHGFPESWQRAVLVRRRSPLWLKAGVVFIHIPRVAGTSINEALYGRFIGHVHASDLARWGSAELNALPSFAVTRNPWARLVSAYRFVTRGVGEGGPNAGRVRYPRQYQGPAFEDFTTFVERWLMARDIRRLDPVFQPQSLFVCGANGEVLVDHVGKIENLAPTLAFLRDRLGRAPDIPRSNRSGSVVDFRSFYTPQLAQLVGSLYAEDVERFGYSFDD